MPKMKIREGDRVRVLTGKYRGREGRVLRALPAKGKVVVEGVNIAHRHTKPRSQQEPGQIREIEMPMDVSNVALIVDGEATRVGYRIDADGSKIRVSKKTGGELR